MQTHTRRFECPTPNRWADGDRFAEMPLYGHKGLVGLTTARKARGD